MAVTLSDRAHEAHRRERDKARRLSGLLRIEADALVAGDYEAAERARAAATAARGELWKARRCSANREKWAAVERAQAAQ